MQNNSTFSNEDRLRLIEMRFKYEISTCPEAKGDGGECGDGSKCTWCRAVAEAAVESFSSGMSEETNMPEDDEIQNLRAEVERLTTALKLAQFDADNYEKMFNREAPFAALGRDVANRRGPTDTSGFMIAHGETLYLAARNILLEESKKTYTAPSGDQFRIVNGELYWFYDGTEFGEMNQWVKNPANIRTQDAAFVAELMKTP